MNFYERPNQFKTNNTKWQDTQLGKAVISLIEEKNFFIDPNNFTSLVKYLKNVFSSVPNNQSLGTQMASAEIFDAIALKAQTLENQDSLIKSLRGKFENFFNSCSFVVSPENNKSECKISLQANEMNLENSNTGFTADQPSSGGLFKGSQLNFTFGGNSLNNANQPESTGLFASSNPRENQGFNRTNSSQIGANLGSVSNECMMIDKISGLIDKIANINSASNQSNFGAQRSQHFGYNAPRKYPLYDEKKTYCEESKNEPFNLNGNRSPYYSNLANPNNLHQSSFGASQCPNTSGGLFGSTARPHTTSGFTGPRTSPYDNSGIFGSTTWPQPASGLLSSSSSSLPPRQPNWTCPEAHLGGNQPENNHNLTCLNSLSARLRLQESNTATIQNKLTVQENILSKIQSDQLALTNQLNKLNQVTSKVVNALKSLESATTPSLCQIKMEICKQSCLIREVQEELSSRTRKIEEKLDMGFKFGHSERKTNALNEAAFATNPLDWSKTAKKEQTRTFETKQDSLFDQAAKEFKTGGFKENNKKPTNRLLVSQTIPNAHGSGIFGSNSNISNTPAKNSSSGIFSKANPCFPNPMPSGANDGSNRQSSNFQTTNASNWDVPQSNNSSFTGATVAKPSNSSANKTSSGTLIASTQPQKTVFGQNNAKSSNNENLSKPTGTMQKDDKDKKKEDPALETEGKLIFKSSRQTSLFTSAPSVQVFSSQASNNTTTKKQTNKL